MSESQPLAASKQSKRQTSFLPVVEIMHAHFYLCSTTTSVEGMDPVQDGGWLQGQHYHSDAVECFG